MAVIRNFDKPTVDLKSEAEVYIVKHAVDRLRRRYAKAADTLAARGATSIEWMMRNRLARLESLFAFIPDKAEVCHLGNKEQVDLASAACEGLITECRLSQRENWDQYTSDMIKILIPLLDRIRIGWKRPAEIPPEVMEQIKAREGGRFWNPNPGDWIEPSEQRVESVDDYTWRYPDWDLVDDFGWIGLPT